MLHVEEEPDESPRVERAHWTSVLNGPMIRGLGGGMILGSYLTIRLGMIFGVVATIGSFVIVLGHFVQRRSGS